MKFTLEISPEEFKQLIGADKVEQMCNEHIKRQLDFVFRGNTYEQDFRDQWPKSVEEYWKHFATWMNQEDVK